MNQIDLNHRHAVITGGAQGIGLSIAIRFLASGASVSLWLIFYTIILEVIHYQYVAALKIAW